MISPFASYELIEKKNVTNTQVNNTNTCMNDYDIAYLNERFFIFFFRKKLLHSLTHTHTLATLVHLFKVFVNRILVLLFTESE